MIDLVDFFFIPKIAPDAAAAFRTDWLVGIVF